MTDFSKIHQLKGLKPKNKGHTKFYECCDLTKKVYLTYIHLPWKWHCNLAKRFSQHCFTHLDTYKSKNLHPIHNKKFFWFENASPFSGPLLLLYAFDKNFVFWTIQPWQSYIISLRNLTVNFTRINLHYIPATKYVIFTASTILKYLLGIYF